MTNRLSKLAAATRFDGGRVGILRRRLLSVRVIVGCSGCGWSFSSSSARASLVLSAERLISCSAFTTSRFVGRTLLLVLRRALTLLIAAVTLSMSCSTDFCLLVAAAVVTIISSNSSFSFVNCCSRQSASPSSFTCQSSSCVVSIS